jgi:hypothetical protein
MQGRKAKNNKNINNPRPQKRINNQPTKHNKTTKQQKEE